MLPTATGGSAPPRPSTPSRPAPNRPALGRFVAFALLLGVVAFGGGFAVAQRIKRTVVDERQWLDEATFVELFTVGSALPGTTSTNVLAMVGLRLAGVRGALAGVAAFLAPSTALMIAFGAAYAHVRSVTVISSLLDGMSAATVGIVAAVAFEMRPAAVHGRIGWLLAVGATLALATHALNLLEVVALAGLVGAFALRPRRARLPPSSAPAVTVERVDDQPFPPGSMRAFLPASPALFAMTLPSLVLLGVFARIGIATFGGGFAMVTPLEREVVDARGWLTQAEFQDAIVLGQVTPGPVAIAATFVGYRVAGIAGALAATVGIFGPPFVLSVVVARSLGAFRRSRTVQGFLRGVAPAIVGVIAASAIALARSSLHGALDGAIAVASVLLLALRPKVSPLVPLAVGGAVTCIVRALGRF